MSNLQVWEKFRVFSPYSELRALLSVFPESRMGEQRSTWNRLTSPSQDTASLLEEGKSPNVELMNVSDTVAKEERNHFQPGH